MNKTGHDAVSSTAPADKDFRTLQAQFALKGHQLHRTEGAKPELFCTRWRLVKHLDDLDHARRFLEQIGGGQ
ncbi:hypothetical protein [Pseudorhodoferax sp. Leaf267]|uniref:hypothetical protein n=1 Tax=Pseudorhodoferax sp. Leaf267 TaxID=1736316 RepID=UPI0006F3E193|nr:hypothetical protein [Pseudorhodoferax sp. Leaf267]KQP20553.1 hypothetical protein ASF43_27395 [Pseudorhodoferax sp. Leaf267]